MNPRNLDTIGPLMRSRAAPRRLGLAVGVLTILLPIGMDAGASQGSVPKVFKGIPQEKGLWRMELFGDQPPATAGGGPPKPSPGFSLCMDSLARMAKADGSGGQVPGSGQLAKCHSSVTEDEANRAVIETHCDNNQHYRTDIRRGGQKEFLLDVAGTANGQAFGLKSRYTYEGPCPASNAARQN